MEIDDNVDFHRRVWIAQRAGWFVIGILIIAALLGFFGSGPFSRTSAQGGGLRIEYDRFARFQQPTKVQSVFYDARPANEIELSRRYFDSVQIEQITPAPSAVESAGASLI